MTTKKSLINVVSTMFAATLLAAGTSAFAANTHYAFAEQTPAQAQPPVDCKEKPEDPSCKDKK